MITVDGMTKTYDDRTVVDRLSFTCRPGTVTGFLGPNGAGKSTTLRMITGLAAPSGGSALVNGRAVPDLPNPAAVVGALLDASAVHPGRTGRAHLRLLAEVVGVAPRRADELLEHVGLADAAGRRVGGYSLGMRQRLGIAGALLAAPPVLIFDEPANGLDPDGIRWLRGLLRDHADRGGTVLLSSHLLAEVEHTVDRLVVIGDGRLVADAPIDELLGTGTTVVRPAAPAAFAAALERAGYRVERTTDRLGDLLTVHAAPAEVGAVAARVGHALVDLRPAGRHLEDLFFQLTA